jgi:hypothetical protein
MTTREYLLDCARAKLGDYRKGSPEVEALWGRVLEPGSLAAQQVKSYAKTKDWCGGFTLDCLREAKLTEFYWKDGSGYVIRLLGYGSVTKSPKPGDIGIRVGPKENPVYHHFLVERWAGPNDWDSIDGNTPTCARKHHTSLDPTTVFYSIEKLLPAMPEAGFARDGEFAVPGVQDKPEGP